MALNQAAVEAAERRIRQQSHICGASAAASFSAITVFRRIAVQVAMRLPKMPCV